MSEAIKPLDEDLEKINMFDPELMACPHAFFKKLRDEAPVYQDPNTGIFQVSKHELICKVARDAAFFKPIWSDSKKWRWRLSSRSG